MNKVKEREYYSRPLPPFGEVIPLKEFTQRYRSGEFRERDGIAYPVKDGYYAATRPIVFKRMYLLPSDATDILWVDR